MRARREPRRQGSRARVLLLGLAVLALVLGACEELKEPLPTAPSPVPPPPFSRFSIVGHWEATTTQGRRIAFDVTEDGRVTNGRINFHHDCNTGRWRATLDGFEAPIVDDGFLVTFNWRANDDGLIRAGTMTVSGRFEGDAVVRGGFVSSVNDVRVGETPSGDLCPTVQGSFEGTRE